MAAATWGRRRGSFRRCGEVRRAGAHAVACTLGPGRGAKKNVVVTVDGVATDAFEGVSYANCDDGLAPGAPPHDDACVPCGAGEFSAKGSECLPCPLGTYSRGHAADCLPCPATEGVACPRGVLSPIDGFFSVADSWDGAAAAVFPCLDAGSCVATNTSETPAAAYACAEGHGGALCATCSKNWYFGGSRCKRCAESKLSPVAAVIIFCVGFMKHSRIL